MDAPRSPWPAWLARPTGRVPWSVCWYVAAIVPFVTAAVRALAGGWFPIGDAAQLYIRATDVLTGHHPWIGSGSSASVSLGFQVNNAGPLYFDLLAPFARTLPPGPGAVLGVTAINVACLVLAGVAARRIGGGEHGREYEAWVLAAGAVLAWTMGSELLFDVFQAHALLFPFLAACVLLTGVVAGQRWVWPWLALVVTLIAQTHLSYAYILAIVVLGGCALGVAGLPAPRRDTVAAAVRSPGAARTAAWTAMVLAVTWWQPLYEQLFGPGEGNLSRLVRASRGTDVVVGFANSVRLTAAFVCWPPFATRPGFEHTLDPSGIEGDRVVLHGVPAGWPAALTVAATLALLAAAWWWARQRGLRALRAVAAFAVLALAGSVVALSRLTVSGLGLAPHHTRWLFVVALVVYATLAWAAADAAAAALGRPARRGSIVTVTASVVLAVCSAANVAEFAQPHGPTADRDAMPALRRVFAQLDHTALAEPVYYDVANVRIYEPYSSAVQLELRERGVEFRISPEFLVRQLGESRRADGTEPLTLRQYEAWAAYRLPDGCLVARSSGLPPGDDAATSARAERLIGAVTAAHAAGRLTLAVPDEAAEIDRTIAAAVSAGDTEQLAEIALDGRLRAWSAAGWATIADRAVAERLATEGPLLTAWLDDLFALATGEICQP
jgi:hypothetical protein